VTGSQAAKWLNVGSDRAGRVRVQNDLTVPEYPEIFVIGDTGSLDQDGRPLPGVAQVAIQQGHYAGELIHRRVTGKPATGPFRYFDKGSLAVVGKGFAVLQSHKLRMSGFLAWLAWGAVHLDFLAQSNLRLSVFLQWIWTGVTGQRGSRLVVNERQLASAKPTPDAAEPSAVRETITLHG
jgi:NADH:ubiquinone reductase (H+-translocating)